MKKLLALFIAISVAFCFFSCGQNDYEPSDSFGSSGRSSSSGGYGSNIYNLGDYDSSSHCKYCGGKGYTVCSSCNGKGYYIISGYSPDYAGTGNKYYREEKDCPSYYCTEGRRDCLYC